jgi:hypothetical protein
MLRTLRLALALDIGSYFSSQSDIILFVIRSAGRGGKKLSL